MGLYLLIGLAAAIALFVYSRSQSWKARRAATETAMAAHVGRPPDFLWRARRVHHLGAALVFAAWLPERKFYATSRADFQAKDVFAIEDVRAVRIEWDTVEGSRGNTFKAAFVLAIELRNIDTPIIKVDASDEPTAAKMQEFLRQMAERPEFYDGGLGAAPST